VWNAEDSKPVGDLSGFGDDIYALVIHGEKVFAGSADRTTRLFSLAERKEIHSLTDNPAWVLSLAWHEASHRVATGCFDGTVTIWNLDDGKILQRFVAVPNTEQRVR
jgi:WD40 repeat protein